MTKFQQSVEYDQGFGVVGEISYEGPKRVTPFVLNSTDEKNNVFGRVFTLNADEKTAGAGGTGEFLGVLVEPKAHASYVRLGDDNQTYVPNGQHGQLLDMGIVNLWTDSLSKIGYKLWYKTTTGEISAQDSSVTTLAGYQLVLNAKAVRFPQESTTGGIIVAQLTN